MVEKPIDLTVVAKGIKDFGTTMEKSADALKKLGVALAPLVPMEKVMVIEGYSGKRRWMWRRKDG